MSIIEDLYYGNAVPSEKSLEFDSEEKKLLNEIIIGQDQLNDTFTDKQKYMFENYNEKQNELNDILEFKRFHDGFITAFKIFTEVMKEK